MQSQFALLITAEFKNFKLMAYKRIVTLHLDLLSSFSLPHISRVNYTLVLSSFPLSLWPLTYLKTVGFSGVASLSFRKTVITTVMNYQGLLSRDFTENYTGKNRVKSPVCLEF